MSKNCILLLFVSVTIGLNCGVPDGSESLHLGQNNAAWVESIYFRGYNPTSYEKLTNLHVERLAQTLKGANIKYAYLFAGPYGDNGTLPQYAFSEQAKSTVDHLKQLYPQLVILPWIGGLQNKTVHLEDSLWVNNAILSTEKLINTLNVKGVHVDMEYLLDTEHDLSGISDNSRSNVTEYGSNVNEFHRKLRERLPNSFISSVVVANSPDTRPWKRKTSSAELDLLTRYVDQISFLYFDTSINSQNVFQKNCKSLIDEIIRLKKKRDIQYLVAVGTFVNEPKLHKYRNLEIENLPNTFSTIKSEIQSRNNRQIIVDGVSVYCDWETDSQEWEQISEYWTKSER